MPLTNAGAEEKVGAGGDVIDRDQSDESSKGGLRDDTCDDDEDLPSFWVIKGGASPTENAAAWRALVEGGGDRVSVPVLALAILIFGDRASGCVNVSIRRLSFFCGTGLLCDMISMVTNQLCVAPRPSQPPVRLCVCGRVQVPARADRAASGYAWMEASGQVLDARCRTPRMACLHCDERVRAPASHLHRNARRLQRPGHTSGSRWSFPCARHLEEQRAWQL